MNTNCGIYKWTNNVNGKVYIGQSVDLNRRKNKFQYYNTIYGGNYINSARKKYNDNKYWNYEILEYCNQEELDNKEIYWIEFYNSNEKENGYNLNAGGVGNKKYKPSETTKIKLSIAHKGENHFMFGKHHSEETIEKIRNSNVGKKRTEETKRKISESHKGMIISEETKQKLSNSLKGRIITEEHKKKLSESQKGKIISEETKKKMRESHKGMTGKKHKEETKKKMSESISKPIFQIDKKTNNIIREWKSATEAANELNISGGHIGDCCKGKRKTTGGFKWQFKSL